MQSDGDPTELHATTRHPAEVKTPAVPDDSVVMAMRVLGGNDEA